MVLVWLKICLLFFFFFFFFVFPITAIASSVANFIKYLPGEHCCVLRIQEGRHRISAHQVCPTHIDLIFKTVFVINCGVNKPEWLCSNQMWTLNSKNRPTAFSWPKPLKQYLWLQFLALGCFKFMKEALPLTTSSYRYKGSWFASRKILISQRKADFSNLAGKINYTDEKSLGSI